MVTIKLIFITSVTQICIVNANEGKYSIHILKTMYNI